MMAVGATMVHNEVMSRELSDDQIAELKQELYDCGYAIARQLVPVEPLNVLVEALLALDVHSGPGGDSSCLENGRGGR